MRCFANVVVYYTAFYGKVHGVGCMQDDWDRQCCGFFKALDKDVQSSLSRSVLVL